MHIARMFVYLVHLLGYTWDHFSRYYVRTRARVNKDEDQFSSSLFCACSFSDTSVMERRER